MSLSNQTQGKNTSCLASEFTDMINVRIQLCKKKPEEGSGHSAARVCGSIQRQGCGPLRSIFSGLALRDREVGPNQRKSLRMFKASVQSQSSSFSFSNYLRREKSQDILFPKLRVVHNNRYITLSSLSRLDCCDWLPLSRSGHLRLLFWQTFPCSPAA